MSVSGQFPAETSATGERAEPAWARRSWTSACAAPPSTTSVPRAAELVMAYRLPLDGR
jgi:hypothetical protein